MKASLLVRRRIAYSDRVFAEVVVWQVPQALPGSDHLYKYRLAFVVDAECVLRIDNEAGKGDRRHIRGREHKYLFQSLDRRLSDFQSDIRSLRHEDRST